MVMVFALFLVALGVCAAQPQAACDAGAGECQGQADDSALLQVSKEGLENPFFAVCDSEFVLCADATCKDPVDGPEAGVQVAECTCWKQAKGASILPSSKTGAPALMNLPGGRAMCHEMKKGELWSTIFVAGNTSYYPPLSLVTCPPHDGFAYCWGAPCREDPTDSTKAICSCPMAKSTLPLPQLVAIETALCPPVTADPCSLTLNSAHVAILLPLVDAGISEHLLRETLCYNFSQQSPMP